MRMPWRAALFVLGTLVGAVPVVADPGAGRRVQSPNLDRAVVHVDQLPGGVPIALRVFGTDDADLGSGADPGKERYHRIALAMKEAAPPALADAFRAEAERDGVFTPVAVLGADEEAPEDAVLVEGEFTVLNPGSRGRRYWIGMGSGRARICVAGTVRLPDGDLAAEFEHCRSGVIGNWGGDSSALMATDIHETGVRIADFAVNLSRGIFRERR